MKSTLKNNHNHTPKQANLMFFKVFFILKYIKIIFSSFFIFNISILKLLKNTKNY
jgi:hypothetical protein